MDAGLGNNPSYVWRSLLAAREIIKEGALWKVGDGKKIEVSMHRWLSHKPIFIGETRPNMLVRELMNTVTIEPKWRSYQFLCRSPQAETIWFGRKIAAITSL